MDRASLYAVLDEFLAALAARDPARLRWDAGLRHSENNVMLEPGDGFWPTITGLGDDRLRFGALGNRGLACGVGGPGAGRSARLKW